MPFVSFLPAVATLVSVVRRVARALLAVSLVGASIVLAVWLTLQWGILPRVEHWRPQIEAWGSRAIGAPVHIEAIDVEGGLWAPVLTLRNVRVQDPAGHDALTLSTVRAVLVPRSLLPASITHWEPRFEQLLIDQPTLDIRRDAGGRLWIGGLPVGRTTPDTADGDDRALDWVLRQREIALRHGQIRWTDDTRKAPTLALSDVDVVLRNGLNRHRLRVDATPPVEWGERLTLQADMRHSLLAVTGLRREGDWQHWRGQVHVHAPLVDVHLLDRYVRLPVALNGGRAALRAWLRVSQGQVDGATVDLALRDVSVTLARGLEPLTVSTLTAEFDAERQPPGLLGKAESLQLDVRRLAFDTGDGVQWPLSDLRVAVQRVPGGDVRNGSFEASVLDLPVLAGLATRLPLAGPLRRLIEQTAPQGRLQQAKLRWQGPLEAPTSWWTAGRADGLSLTSASAPPQTDAHPHPGRPGVRDAQVDYEFTDRGGRATVQIRRGALELPGVFEDPLVPLDEFSGEVRWRVDEQPGRRPSITVDMPKVQFVNADARGQFDGRWTTGADGRGAVGSRYLPGHLDLHARLSSSDATRVHRYLPLGLPASVRHYVRDAVRRGQLPQVVARVRGDLHDFPFAAPGSGEFTVRAQVTDAEFAYVPPNASATGPASQWPAFTHAEAELLFDRQSMQIRRGRALVGSVGSGAFALSPIEGGIADFTHAPTLRIGGRGRGPAADALAYVRQSPVGELMGHALDAGTATGATDLQLDLTVPLDHPDKTEVRGSVQLAGNTVQLRPDVPTLVDARAKVDFHSHGFTMRGGTAQALGGTVTFDGTQDADALRITAQGQATAEGLRRASELPLLAWLGGQLTGQAPYRLQMAFHPGGRAEMQLTSPLTGMASRLPAPLAKPAGEQWPLKVSMAPQPEPGRHLLRVELANGPAAPTLVDAMYLRQTGPDGAASVLRGAIGVGAAAVLPAPQEPLGTVAATIAMPQVSIDPWTDWADRLSSAPPTTPPAAGLPKVGAATGADEVDTYLPDRMTLRTAQLRLRGVQLTGVVATLDRQRAFDGPRPVTDWRVDLLADQAAGRIDWRDAGGSGANRTEASRLQAHLSRLSVPRELTSEAAAAPRAGTPAIDALPAMDVVVDDLVWRGKALGRVELQAANRLVPAEGERAASREWRIGKLTVTLPEGRFSALGNWAQASVGAPRRTALTFTLEMQDGGKLLERFGLPGTLRGGAGDIKGQVRWTGSPLDLHWPSLAGDLHVAMDRGEFLRAEPGVARLLGVLSLQSLPRRLLFDFRDVFREGFSFDHVDGDASIVRGIATTHNLRIRGVQGVVLTEGTSDLVNETQDLHVWVVPDINAGAASLAYAAINPAIGLGTLIGQLFLRKSLTEAATRQFHVTGTWQAPQVDPVEGDRARPSPSMEATPPAASASTPLRE